MSEIKTPVTIQDAGASVEIIDATDKVIAKCYGDLDGDTYYPGGYYAAQIADALNASPSQALEQRLAELIKFATVVSDVFTPTNDRESMAYHKLRQALDESYRIAQTEVIDERTI